MILIVDGSFAIHFSQWLCLCHGYYYDAVILQIAQYSIFSLSIQKVKYGFQEIRCSHYFILNKLCFSLSMM